MRHAIVRRLDGVIVNVIEWDGRTKWSPPEGCDAVPADQAEAEPGGRWDGARFHRAPLPGHDRAALVARAIDLDVRLAAARRLAATVPEAQSEADRLAAELDAVRAQLGAPRGSP